jgi:hypothetical protein
MMMCCMLLLISPLQSLLVVAQQQDRAAAAAAAAATGALMMLPGGDGSASATRGLKQNNLYPESNLTTESIKPQGLTAGEQLGRLAVLLITTNKPTDTAI